MNACTYCESAPASHLVQNQPACGDCYHLPDIIVEGDLRVLADRTVCRECLSEDAAPIVMLNSVRSFDFSNVD